MKIGNKISAITITLLALSVSVNAVMLKPLVSTDWLAKHKNEVVILDIRKNITKKTKTISGAVIVNWKQLRTKRVLNGVKLEHMVPTKEQFSTFMQNLGVNKNSTIIVSDKGNLAKTVFFGTRLYWQIKYFGYDNVALLDGGTAKWKKEKRAMSLSTKLPKGDFIATTERTELIASTQEVKNALNNKTLLLDSRPEDMYLGTFYKKKDVGVAGHIAGAKALFGDIFLKHGGVKTFLPTSTMKAILKAKNINANANAITYCNTGHLASGTWFVEHELLGNKNVKLYDGSMHAWVKNKANKINTIVYE